MEVSDGRKNFERAELVSIDEYESTVGVGWQLRFQTALRGRCYRKSSVDVRNRQLHQRLASGSQWANGVWRLRCSVACAFACRWAESQGGGSGGVHCRIS